MYGWPAVSKRLSSSKLQKATQTSKRPITHTNSHPPPPPPPNQKTGGSVSGIVGAGGNVGAIVFTMLFLSNKFATTASGFRVMGWCVMVCAFAIWGIRPELLSVDPLDETIEKGEEFVKGEKIESLDATSVSIASLEEGELEETKEAMPGIVVAKVSV